MCNRCFKIKACQSKLSFSLFLCQKGILLSICLCLSVRRQLLGELLLDRHNFTTMTRYISNPDNLKLMMNMLREKSRNIQFEAFHVFKVFIQHEATLMCSTCTVFMVLNYSEGVFLQEKVCGKPNPGFGRSGYCMCALHMHTCLTTMPQCFFSLSDIC